MDYKRTVECISKHDFFACLSLWMEHCPLASVPAENVGENINSDYDSNGRHFEETFEEPIKKKVKIETKQSETTERGAQISSLSSPQFNNGIVTEFMGSSDIQIRGPANINNDNQLVYKDGTSNDCHESLVNKVGCVIVDSDGQIIAMDCSRDNVHAVANAIISNPDKARGSVVYASRKPCSFCTKWMAQLQISRIYYLPLEPEIPDQEDLASAERIQCVCSIANSVLIPNISDQVLHNSLIKPSPYTSNKSGYEVITPKLIEHYWSNDWVSRVQQFLLWPEFEDLQEEVSRQMERMFNWLTVVTLCDVPNGTKFFKYNEIQITPKTPSVINNSLLQDHMDVAATSSAEDFCPNVMDPKWQALALHMTRMAQILSQQSDDPTRGVGAVILKENEVVAAGWNGYISGSKYGDFPRASSKDGEIKAKKYPFSIHGEQSVILNRFVPQIKHNSTTIFTSKMPCDECVPLMIKVGIPNVVFPPENKEKPFIPQIQAKLLKKSIASRKLSGYVSVANAEQEQKRILQNEHLINGL